MKLLQTTVLKYLLQAPEKAPGVPAAFFDGPAAEIFTLVKEGKDFLAVTEMRPDLSNLVSEILTSEPQEALTFESAVSALEKECSREKLRVALREAIVDSGTKPLEAVVLGLQRDIEALRTTSRQARTFTELLSELEAKNNAQERDFPRWGLPSLDRLTGGLEPGRLFVIAAAPGTGKTALSNQVCIRGSLDRHRPIIVSLEMSELELTRRFLANRHGLPLGGLTQRHKETINQFKSRDKSLDKLDIHIETNVYDLHEIESVLATNAMNGSKLAVVDHAALIHTAASDSEYARISKVTRSLKIVAKRFSLAIILVSQLNRNAARDGREIGLSDLRGSGSLEQDADLVMFIEREGEPSAAGLVPITLRLAKNRSGPVRDLFGMFQFDGRTQRFTETAKRGES